jgi:hypothetical protein
MHGSTRSRRRPRRSESEGLLTEERSARAQREALIAQYQKIVEDGERDGATPHTLPAAREVLRTLMRHQRDDDPAAFQRLPDAVFKGLDRAPIGRPLTQEERRIIVEGRVGELISGEVVSAEIDAMCGKQRSGPR